MYSTHLPPLFCFSYLHHPVGDVNLSLVSDKLKNPTMGCPGRLLVGELEQHGVDDVQPDIRILRGLKKGFRTL